MMVERHDSKAPPIHGWGDFALKSCPVSSAFMGGAQKVLRCIPSRRGLDNRVYYMLAPEGQYYNYSGCGNTVNCNHPIVRNFILDALRYWVQEMHVDGFRFDLGSIMTRTHSLWHQPSLPDGSSAPDVPMPEGEKCSIP